MTRKEALAKAIEATQAGTLTGGNSGAVPRHMSRIIETALGDDDEIWSDCVGAHDGSLDAAKALHGAVFPRHYAQLHMWPMPEMCRVDIGQGHTGRAENPARAWLLAILCALHSMEDAQ